jgi:hypothetical protein
MLIDEVPPPGAMLLMVGRGQYHANVGVEM